MLIGGVPVTVFCFMVFALGYAFRDHDVVGFWIALLASVVSFRFACRRRRKRRLIASSLFPVEVAAGVAFGAMCFVTLWGGAKIYKPQLVGVVFGAVCFITLAAVGYAAYGPRGNGAEK